MGGGGWGGHAVGMGFASRGPVGFASRGPVGFAGARSFGWHGNNFRGNNFAFHNRFAFRNHRFFRNRLFFAAGVGFPYGYYDDGCLARVWTPYGWSWQNVCSY
jgi:hypothetical protein